MVSTLLNDTSLFNPILVSTPIMAYMIKRHKSDNWVCVFHYIQRQIYRDYTTFHKLWLFYQSIKVVSIRWILLAIFLGILQSINSKNVRMNLVYKKIEVSRFLKAIYQNMGLLLKFDICSLFFLFLDTLLLKLFSYYCQIITVHAL